MKQFYIGDGVYAEDQGFQIRLFTQRVLNIEHEIYLEPEAITTLFKFLEATRGLKITVERVAHEKACPDCDYCPPESESEHASDL